MSDVNDDNITKVLSVLFGHLITIKMFHFQTHIGFRHLKMDDYLTTFLEKLDRFCELWQGEFGKLPVRKMSVDVTTRTDENFIYYLVNFEHWLRNLDDQGSDAVRGAKDDMATEVVKLQYLMRQFQ